MHHETLIFVRAQTRDLARPIVYCVDRLNPHGGVIFSTNVCEGVPDQLMGTDKKRTRILAGKNIVRERDDTTWSRLVWPS